VNERLKNALAWLLALGAVLTIWRTRVELTRATPVWNATNPEGLFKSDPALLYWFTRRAAENGGAQPDDFAHTSAVQWPDVVDARVEFPQTQMALAARTWHALGSSLALHEWCVVLFSLLAAATGLGVYGLARELSGSRVLGLLALGAWGLGLASWRSTSYVLLGEDVSFPAFALHLWLLARTTRVRTPGAFLLAGLALLVALMSWHAMSFFVAMETAAILAWCVRSGAQPFRVRHAWLVLAPFVLGCALEPMLRGKQQILSLPMQLVAALAALSWLEARRARAGRPALSFPARATLAVGAWIGGAGVAALVSRLSGGGIGDYSHVFGLIAAKLRHLGTLPEDPSVLPFEVRILWQGPFETIPPLTLALNLTTGLLGAPAIVALCVRSWWRGAGPAREAVLALFTALSLLATWLILRTVILSAVLLPVACVVALATWRARQPRLATSLAALVLLVPPLVPLRQFVTLMPRSNTWYNPGHVRELRELAQAIRAHVPAGEPIAADEVNSTAILAHTDHPILVQPKYESAAARARLQEYRFVATRGTPEELAAYLRAHRTRYLAFDWRTLWSSRYQVGIANDVNAMPAGSALAAIVQDPARVSGFQLLWKSPGGRFALYQLR
jgi:hypothetical protein